MTNWEKDKIDLNNIGIATFDEVDTNIIGYLKTQIKNKKQLKNANAILAGHIKDEYHIKVTNDYSNYICRCLDNNPITSFYLNKIDILNKNCPIILDKSWINFQKKHEFNPLHDHTGIFSFIIFMQIPYKLEEEFKVYADTNGKHTSCLSFAYTDTNGSVVDKTCSVDESYLYKMLIFPAKLKHMVYPFYTSDEERITVSGNVKFLIN
jgi:hypothetical protein